MELEDTLNSKSFLHLSLSLAFFIEKKNTPQKSEDIRIQSYNPHWQQYPEVTIIVTMLTG